MDQNSIDRTKLYRTLLHEYAGTDCHNYGPPITDRGPYRAVYKNDGNDWESVSRNIRDLLVFYNIEIELDRYPSTKLITITLEI